jgi:MFS family permease
MRRPLRWTYLAFYVWVGVLAVPLGVSVVSSALRLFSPAEKEKGIAVLAPAFAIGGLTGSVLAGWSAAWVMIAFGWRYEVFRDNLMLGMAACLLLQVPFAYAIDRRSPSDPMAVPTAPRVLVFHMAVSLMYGLRVVENALRATLYEPALDRALLQIPEDLAGHARPWLKGPGPRIGEGVGALLVLGLAATPRFDPGTAALALLSVLLVWLGAAIMVRPALRAEAR